MGWRRVPPQIPLTKPCTAAAEYVSEAVVMSSDGGLCHPQLWDPQLALPVFGRHRRLKLFRANCLVQFPPGHRAPLYGT